MADETMSTFTRQIQWSPGYTGPQSCKINGSAIKPGYVVGAIGETFSTRDVALLTNATFDVPYGVVEVEADNDIDTVFTDNDMCKVYRKGTGYGVWVFLKTSSLTAVDPGTPLYAPCDGGGAVDVLMKNATNDTTSINRYISASRRFIGIADDEQAVTAGGWTCIKILLTGFFPGVTGTG